MIKKICLIIVIMLPLMAVAQTVSLNGKWELSFWKQPAVAVTSPEGMKLVHKQTIAATVPGNVELDLMEAGLYDMDIMRDKRATSARKWEAYQWCYSRTFASPAVKAYQRVELFFGGVDCLADVWLNGKQVGRTDNMMIPHSFDITPFLKNGGSNLLQVIIRSATAEAQKYMVGTTVHRAHVDPASIDFLNIRKSPHSYGWSIFPRMVSAALFRDVEVRIVNPVAIKDVNWDTVSIDTAGGSADIYADFQLAVPVDRIDDMNLEFTLSYGDSVVATRTVPLLGYAGRQHFRIDNVRLWWPRGYGDPALYGARVRVIDKKEGLLAENVRKIGVRTVRLERNDLATKEHPGKFCFYVNGERIFVRGTNWIPVDMLQSRERQLLPDILAMVADLNCNLVRVWGGGLYEHDDFYDFCDANGIMVWQDFAFACTMYPQDDEFARKVEKEVRSVVVRLRNHPSIALWCGNNESDRSLLWQLSALGIDPAKDRISRAVIPNVLWEFDPTRPYLPSSPYHSPAVVAAGQSDHIIPESHLWSSAYYKDQSYTGVNSAFVSELGFYGHPNRSSIEKIDDPKLTYPWTNDGKWNDKQIRNVFGNSLPSDLAGFITASQIAHAEGLKYSIEFWRGGKWDRTGLIWWNLRDGWPISSNAPVDYFNSRKLAYYYIRNVQADVCALINDPADGAYPLVVVNDTREPYSGQLTVTDVASGQEVFNGRYDVEANGRQVVANIPALNGQGIMQIRYQVEGKERKNHYLYGNIPFEFDDYMEWYKKMEIYDMDLLDQSK